MYAENGKISSRQIFRLYVFDLMGIATLLLPPYLAKLCGIDGIFVIIGGTVLGIFYLSYLGWVMKKMNMDIRSYLRTNISVFWQKLFFFLLMAHSILTAGFCAYVFGNLMQYSLVKESSFATILLVLLLAAAYAVSGGLESRARSYEVLFCFVLIPYVLMMLASVREFEPLYLDGFFQTDAQNLFQGMYLVVLFLTPLFFSLFLIGEKEKHYGSRMGKPIRLALVISAGILLGSYILLLGNFGAAALADMRYPVVTLMSTIQFQGNFLKRMDALMLAVWFFTLYALLNLHLHYAVEMGKELRPALKTKWRPLLLPTVLVFAAAWMMQQNKACVWYFLDYYSYFALPFMLIVPGILLLAKGHKRENKKENRREKSG